MIWDGMNYARGNTDPRIKKTWQDIDCSPEPEHGCAAGARAADIIDLSFLEKDEELQGVRV